MTGSTQDILDLYALVRNVIWRYKLDQFEEVTLKDIQETVDNARREISKRFEEMLAKSEWRSDRDEQILNWLENVSVGVREALTHQIADVTGEAADHSIAEHSAIVSLDGKLPGFTNVELTKGQLRQFFLDTPLGAGTLATWVDRSFDATVTAGIKQELNTGVLQGEGYGRLVKRLQDGFQDLSRRESITLARTYVQTANVAASQAVYSANQDIVKGWRWCAVMEVGYMASGRGTCLVCASLDGQEFPIGDGPGIPAHPRCRCSAVPVLASWRDLGIPIDEIESAVRPYTIRPDENVDEGGKRAILEVGHHQGDYGSWFAKQSEEHQRDVLGPNRFKLYDEGKVDFSQFTDTKGNLRNIVWDADHKPVGLEGLGR